MTSFENLYPEEPEQEGLLEEIIKAPFRGVAGAAAGVANLFGADIQDNFGLGKSQGMIGGFLEGTSQFLSGFIPVAGWLGRAGALSKGAQVAARAAGATGKARAIGVARGAVAGAAADGLVFDGHDPRVSNLIQDVPGLQNPLTEYLAAKDDDSELEGRLKNILEGAALGTITEGIFRMIKLMRKSNKATAAGDAKGAAEAQKELQDVAGDTWETPESTLDLDRDVLLDESKLDPEANKLLEEPEVPEGGLDLEEIPATEIEQRIGPDPDQGEIIVVNTKSANEVARGLSHQDFYTRQPNSPLTLLQLKAEAKVMRNSERREIVGLRRPGESREAYAKRVEDTAKAQGFDAVQMPKGKGVETTVFKEEAIAKKLDVESQRSFFDLRQELKDTADEDIIASSRILTVATKLTDMTPSRTMEFATAARAAKRGDKEALEKIPGIINLAKQSGEGREAMTQFMIEEFNWLHLVDDAQTHEQWIKEGAREAAQMTGFSPQVIAKNLEVAAGNVDKARSMALGANWVMQKLLDSMQPLIKEVSELKVTDVSELAEGQARSLEMLARAAEDYSTIASGFSKVRRSAGRLLQSFNVGLDKMEVHDLFQAIDARGGVSKMIRAAKRMATEAGFDNGHLGRLITQKSRSARMWEAFTPWWMFSLLSTPRTFTTNFTGAGLAAYWRPIERIIGGWLGSKTLSPEAAEGLHRTMRAEGRGLRHMSQSLVDIVTFKDAVERSPMANQTVDAVKRSARDAQGVLLPRGNVGNLDFGTNPRPQGTPEKPVSRMAEWFHKTIKIPSQLMVGGDEIWKQLKYQSNIKSKLEDIAADQGLTGRDAERFVQEETRKMSINGTALTERNLLDIGDQKFSREAWPDETARQQQIRKYADDALADGDVPDRAGIAEAAVNAAEEVTFTGDMKRGTILGDLGHHLTEFSKAHPWMVMFTPFIKTPMNLLQFAADRMPIPLVNKEFVPMLAYMANKKGILPDRLAGISDDFARQINSGDPEVVADAVGRAVTTVGVASVLGTAASAGVITGGGPRDPKQLKVLKSTGWQPYSIKVGDTYVSYQRLDPLATLMSFWGDYSDIARYSPVEREGVDAMAHSFFTATLDNLQNKSYLAGVIDLVKLVGDPDTQWEKMAGRLAGTAAVPGVLAGMRDFADPHSADLRGIVDRVVARIPFMSANVLEPQRNVLGEVVSKKQLSSGIREAGGVASYFMPLMVNRTSSDTVTKELASLAFPFTNPEPHRLGVDLREFTSDSGQTAYDRWQELTGEVKVQGRMLRPALDRLIKSKEYQRLQREPLEAMDISSPRVSMINRLVGKYRRAAERQLFKEFPELQEQTRLRTMVREQLQRGAQQQDIGSLIGN